MEKRSIYRNPLLRIEQNQPSKTFKVFTSAASAARWLRDPNNAKRVCLDARGNMKVRRWKDGHVAVTMYGSVRSSYRLNLAPVRHLTPELWALENRRDACV